MMCACCEVKAAMHGIFTCEDCTSLVQPVMDLEFQPMLPDCLCDETMCASCTAFQEQMSEIIALVPAPQLTDAEILEMADHYLHGR